MSNMAVDTGRNEPRRTAFCAFLESQCLRRRMSFTTENASKFAIYAYINIKLAIRQSDNGALADVVALF